MRPETKEWIRKAEADQIIANQCRLSEFTLHDGVCFHSQQCAEKYLKGLLAEIGSSIPKTHNLDDLYNLLLSSYPPLRKLRRGLILLTDYAVENRYPGENATKRQAVAALRWAMRIRESCRNILGVKSGSAKRKTP
jgi:HEPN domain-containing protein